MSAGAHRIAPPTAGAPAGRHHSMPMQHTVDASSARLLHRYSLLIPYGVFHAMAAAIFTHTLSAEAEPLLRGVRRAAYGARHDNELFVCAASGCGWAAAQPPTCCRAAASWTRQLASPNSRRCAHQSVMHHAPVSRQLHCRRCGFTICSSSS